MTNLLEILKNNFKTAKNILIIVFGINIDIKSFIARLLNHKLQKAIKITSKILAKQLIIFLNI